MANSANLIQLYTDDNKTKKAYPIVNEHGIYDDNGNEVISNLKSDLIQVSDKIYEVSNFKYGRTITEGKYNDKGTVKSQSGMSILEFDVSRYDYVTFTSNLMVISPYKSVNLYKNGTFSKYLETSDCIGKVLNVADYDSIQISCYTTDNKQDFITPIVAKKNSDTEAVIVQKILPVIESNHTSGWQWYTKTTADVIGWVFDVSSADKVFVDSFTPKAYYNSYTLFDANDNIIDYALVKKNDAVSYTLDTRYASKLLVCAQTSLTPKVMAYKKMTGTLVGKKAVWFGTSIPWGSNFKERSYPFMVGGLTGMYVYNESIPESCVSGMYDGNISTTNPYGLDSNFTRATRNFGATIEAIKWAVENYNSSVFTRNVPSTKPTGYTAIEMWQNSYEVKLLRYLTKCESDYTANYPYGGFVGDVDYYIFNHGHNDDMNYNGDSSFTNTMNMLMDIIVRNNPDAKIVIIGEYENQTTLGQKIDNKLSAISSSRCIPYFKLYNSLGWTQQELDFNGQWVKNTTDGGYDWVDTAETHTMSIFAANVPDGVHPSTDNALKGTKQIALAIANFLQSV